MIFNIVLGLLTVGWLANAGAFGGREKFLAYYLNTILAAISMSILVYRLS